MPPSQHSTPRANLIPDGPQSRYIDRLASLVGYGTNARETLSDVEALWLIRWRYENEGPSAGRLAWLSDACRSVTLAHRTRRTRAARTVEGAGYAAPGATDDPGVLGAVAEARDVLRVDVRLAVDDGRSALERAERAIEAGDVARAKRSLTLADEMLAQIRELQEQADGVLVRAQQEASEQAPQLWAAVLTPVLIDVPGHGTWVRPRGT